jgi:hypothetical protein
MDKPTTANSLELIWRVKAIAAELGLGERQTYYVLEKGIIPATKFGRKWGASRVLLREYMEKTFRDANAAMGEVA